MRIIRDVAAKMGLTAIVTTTGIVISQSLHVLGDFGIMALVVEHAKNVSRFYMGLMDGEDFDAVGFNEELKWTYWPIPVIAVPSATYTVSRIVGIRPMLSHCLTMGCLAVPVWLISFYMSMVNDDEDFSELMERLRDDILPPPPNYTEVEGTDAR